MATIDSTSEARTGGLDPHGPGLAWGLDRIRKALKRHEAERCPLYAARERVWLAVREGESDARIQHQRIRFAYQRTDVLMSYLTTDKPVARVAPLVPGESCEKASKSAQRAMNEWRRRNHRDEKETLLAQTACIFGNAPYKEIWDYDRRLLKHRQVKKSWLGLGSPTFNEVEDWRVLKDEPNMIPWNPYDFAWDPRATSEDTWRYVVFFDYPSKAELLAMQQQGLVHNIDELQPASARESQRFQRPGKMRDLEGCIEVAEIWDIEENRQVTIANRGTLICDQDSPYWHGEIPGGVCTTMPNLWTLDGTSEVEIIAAIQAELHSFRENWILDGKLATKLIAFIDSSISMTELEKVNNALIVDDGKPVQVITVDPGSQPPTFWNPGAQLVSIGENVIGSLKTDMDDMSGVNQYISGQTEGEVDPKTATEVQQLATASQRRINAKKNQLGRGYERASIQDLKNMRQFMTTPLVIRMDGAVADAAISQGPDYSFDSVDPQDVVDAEFELLMTNADESIDKQEQRQMWMLLFNTFSAAAAVFPPGSSMPDFGKLAERLLEAYDVEDPSEFMLEPPPPLPVGPPMLPDGEPPALGGGSGGPTPLGPVPPPLAGGPGQAGPSPGAVA